MRCHYAPTRICKIKKWIILSVAKDMEQLKLLYISGDIKKCCSYFGKCCDIVNLIYASWKPLFTQKLVCEYLDQLYS